RYTDRPHQLGPTKHGLPIQLRQDLNISCHPSRSHLLRLIERHVSFARVRGGTELQRGWADLRLIPTFSPCWLASTRCTNESFGHYYHYGLPIRNVRPFPVPITASSL